MADWDGFSLRYDRIFLENPVYVEILEKIAEMARSVAPRFIVDVGCGTGNVSERLHTALPEAGLTGVDPSTGMRERYLERFSGFAGVRALQGSGTEIPLPDGEADLLVSNLALHHIPDGAKGECAAELARVLRLGGTLLYADMFIDVDAAPPDPTRARDVIEKQMANALYCLDHGAYDMMRIMIMTLLADIDAEGEYLTTPAFWGRTLEAAGFEVVEVLEVRPAELGLRIIHARLPLGSGT